MSKKSNSFKSKFVSFRSPKKNNHVEIFIKNNKVSEQTNKYLEHFTQNITWFQFLTATNFLHNIILHRLPPLLVVKLTSHETDNALSMNNFLLLLRCLKILNVHTYVVLSSGFNRLILYIYNFFLLILMCINFLIIRVMC